MGCVYSFPSREPEEDLYYCDEYTVHSLVSRYKYPKISNIPVNVREDICNVFKTEFLKQKRFRKQIVDVAGNPIINRPSVTESTESSC